VLKKIFFWTALTWSVIILVSCLIKSDEIPQVSIQNLDKVVHAFFYFVFTSLWFLYFKKHINSSNNFKPLAISFAFSVFFGIGIELLQAFITTTRKADVFDVFANVTGTTLAVIAIILLNKYNGIIDKI
jgi:VanZ family protein